MFFPIARSPVEHDLDKQRYHTCLEARISLQPHKMRCWGVVMGWSLVTSVAARPRFGKPVLSCLPSGFEMLLAAYTFPTRTPAIRKTSRSVPFGWLGLQVEIWQSVFQARSRHIPRRGNGDLLLVRSLLQVFRPQYLS